MVNYATESKAAEYYGVTRNCIQDWRVKGKIDFYREEYTDVYMYELNPDIKSELQKYGKLIRR